MIIVYSEIKYNLQVFISSFINKADYNFAILNVLYQNIIGI